MVLLIIVSISLFTIISLYNKPSDIKVQASIIETGNSDNNFESEDSINAPDLKKKLNLKFQQIQTIVI